MQTASAAPTNWTQTPTFDLLSDTLKDDTLGDLTSAELINTLLANQTSIADAMESAYRS